VFDLHANGNEMYTKIPQTSDSLKEASPLPDTACKELSGGFCFSGAETF